MNSTDFTTDSAIGAVDLSSPLSVHIIGIGGAGMSAIAEVLRGSGHTVAGSDLNDSVVAERLRQAGINVSIGHDKENVGDVDVVTHSTAIPASNPELVEATSRQLPVLRRAEILTAITKVWKTASVAGTHGKTTTSAMLTAALRGAKLDPAFIVGGDLCDLGHGAAVGSGEYLVVEADESDGTFVELESHSIVVTNVEPDHLEHYGGFENLRKAFIQFVCEASGPKVICIDDPGAAELAASVRSRGIEITTYGVADTADWKISNPLPTPGGISAEISGNGTTYELRLQQPGMHNVRNAAAAFAVAVELGADPDLALEALNNFGGVGRRFERRGEFRGIQIVDDYAHLPTEVEAALSAGRSLAPDRLVAVFQPHRYSRTEQLWSTFGNSFTEADVLLVTGIYSSGEAPREGITGKLVANAVTDAHPELDVRYVESLEDVTAELVAELVPGDLCMTLGAGDLTTIADDILAGLASKVDGDG